MMDVQLEQLRTLAAVLDEGTLEAAARQLNITPSAVSQRLKALETSVGAVLVRRSKPVTVTESGAILQRLARQVTLLEADARRELSGTTGDQSVRLPVVINADSLATWVMPALAELATGRGALFEVFREDEAHSVELLRDGTAIAAVTSVAEPVQGCSSELLGSMRYRPMASPAYRDAWLSQGPTAEALAVAPVMVFDRRDDLQDQYLRRRSRRPLSPPRHWVPASTEFLTAVRLGLGWGMLPDLQSEPYEQSGELVAMEPGAAIDVPLYWQRWNLDSPLLAALTHHVRQAAAARLRQPGE